MTFDIAIVGAGASGLAAGIAAGRAFASDAGGPQATPTGRVLLLERMPRVGKKILATGNGRCNLGNRNALEHPYHNREFAVPALERFGAWGCDSFFDSLGLAVREEDEGRLYPRSNMAASVLDALRFGALRAGCEIRCDCPVSEIKRVQDGFSINKSIAAQRMIIAAGGCAAPAQGSDGSGFSLLRALGHSVIEPKPALVQIKCDSPLLPMLKGMRVHAQIKIERDGAVLRRAEGEILFTGDGLSGIAAMEVSREAASGTTAVLDLLPEYTMDGLNNLLARWKGIGGLPGLLPKRVAEAVEKNAGDPKHFTFPVTGTRGFAHAQVTAGGADVSQFDPATMGSRIVPGLFASGEALDVDGGCGGFNLHWAWASGMLAGSSAALG